MILVLKFAPLTLDNKVNKDVMVVIIRIFYTFYDCVLIVWYFITTKLFRRLCYVDLNRFYFNFYGLL